MVNLRQLLEAPVVRGCCGLWPHSDQRPCLVGCVESHSSCPPLQDRYVLLLHFSLPRAPDFAEAYDDLWFGLGLPLGSALDLRLSFCAPCHFFSSCFLACQLLEEDRKGLQCYSTSCPMARGSLGTLSLANDTKRGFLVEI